MVSGTTGGEVVIWEYLPTVDEPGRRLTYRDKVVAHQGRINQIGISTDLRVAIVAGQDGFLSILDVVQYSVVRMIEVGRPVLCATLLTSPYYMFFISCPGRQYCYSLNGQFL